MSRERRRKGPGDVKVGKKFAYVDLPDNMEECFYDLELLEVKELDTGNIAFEWLVLDTDTRAKIDSEISSVLYPFQRLAEIYYFRELFAIETALAGKKLTQKRIDKLKDSWQSIEEALLNNDKKYIGRRARCVIKSRIGEDGKARSDRYWELLED